MTSACRLGVMTLVCMLLWSAPLAAQSPSLSLVRQLTTLLEAMNESAVKPMATIKPVRIAVGGLLIQKS